MSQVLGCGMSQQTLDAAVPRLQAWLPVCPFPMMFFTVLGDRRWSFSPRLSVVSTLSQRNSRQGWEPHQRINECRAPQLDIRGLMSSGLVSWS